jgi:hypothetical protein
MRSRERILRSLEGVFREAWERASEAGDSEAMARLDFEYQLEQLRLEVLLDLRELLEPAPGTEPSPTTSLIEKAEALKRITRLR